MARRSRYYQGNMDLALIKKGMPLEELPKTFVIFICTFDYFEQGRHLYRFEHLCLEDEGLRLQDGAQKIYLNTKGKLNDVSDELKDFLKYVETTTRERADMSRGSLVRNIQKKVELVKNDEAMGVEFMTIEEKMQYRWEDGWNEGKEKGRIEGRKEGERIGLERLNKLFRRLIADQRMEDLEKSTSDAAYQERLLEEYGL